MTVAFTRNISPGRLAAFDVLTAVAGGKYASDTLIERTRSLDSRDAGLASQIVFGCLRYQGQLDHLIFFYSGRKPADLDESVTIALRAAIFQLRYLDRIPSHAAVHESVEFVKSRKRAAAGFANAVLRKVNRAPVEWPNAAVELSCPSWLLDRWIAHFGWAQARAVGQAALEEPSAYIRVAPGSNPPNDVCVEATSVPGCFRLLSPVPHGARLHDIGSQSVLRWLDLRPGHTFLDLCAAPGNKTLQALETPLTIAVACDISPKRICDIPPICPRVVLDASRRLPFSRPFDRIFIDAPCSGTGTLGRNPEIKWRVQIEEFARFGEKQSRILSQAVQLLVPGGKLLYATCSLEPEENEAVVQSTLRMHPELRCERELWRLPGRDEGDGFYAAVLC
ncbi:MAG: transcription antitermination factor NusB [Bryobacteraceae bacterium]